MALYTWGHNNAQQLGLGVDDKVVFDVRRVDALAREAIVDVSAGEQHTLVVTEFGDVFAWGRGKEGQLGLSRAAISAPLPARVTRGGLGGEHVVQVACGDAHSLALSASGRVFMWGLLPAAVGAHGSAGTAGDDASDRAAVSLAGMSAVMYEEQPALSPRSLRASMSDALTARLVVDSTRAFEAEEVTAVPANGTAPGTRTVRRPAFVPRPSAALARERVVAVAAGFAHSLAVTAAGRVLSCGYNDNGQLGSGSRRHTPDFSPVIGLDGVHIARVACGQQHSLAVSVRSPRNGFGDGSADDAADGAVFAWGLGVLGQLGSGPGMPVAYRPVRVPVPAPAVSVAAGAHHSVAVAADGRCYSWGHSEYGQHGAAAGGGTSTDDLQRRANYFYPRLQAALADEDEPDPLAVARAREVACSAHSTFVVASRPGTDLLTESENAGQLWSWGWNAFGALGNGKVQRSAHPQLVAALAARDVRRVAAGANHGAAIVRPRGCHYAMRLDAVLARGDFADVAVAVKGSPGVLLAHRVVLAARCAYLGGQLRAADAGGDRDEDGRLQLDTLADEDAAVVRALLGFLYTARVDVAAHKRRALAVLAKRVHCEALAAACEDPWRRIGSGRDEEVEVAGEREFERDMAAALVDDQLADVEFLWPAEGEEEPARVLAHRVVLAQVEYFRSMFLGGFREAEVGSDGRREVSLAAMPRDGVTLAAFRRLLRWVYTGSFEALLPGVGGPVEGLEEEEEGPAAAMDLLVAAGRLGLRELAALSERRLLEWLPRLARGDAGSLRACRDFGARFGARKLRAMSRRLLREAGELDEVDDEEEEEEEEDD